MVDTFNPRYTYTKRGIYYFCKDVPVNLGHHTRLRIVQSLRTKSPMDNVGVFTSILGATFTLSLTNSFFLAIAVVPAFAGYLEGR